MWSTQVQDQRRNVLGIHKLLGRLVGKQDLGGRGVEGCERCGSIIWIHKLLGWLVDQQDPGGGRTGVERCGAENLAHTLQPRGVLASMSMAILHGDTGDPQSQTQALPPGSAPTPRVSRYATLPHSLQVPLPPSPFPPPPVSRR